jgi:hypothetical protein
VALTPGSFDDRNAAKEKRQEGTGNWFITSTAFLEWKLGLRRHLWLHGLAGCGKTVLTSTILDHLHDARPGSCVCLDFLFDFRDQDKQHLRQPATLACFPVVFAMRRYTERPRLPLQLVRRRPEVGQSSKVRGNENMILGTIEVSDKTE